MVDPLTVKQLEFWYAKDARLNFLYGAVRSGKTYVSILKFIAKVIASPADYVFLMTGKTIVTLEQNVLLLMKAMCADDFIYSVSRQRGWLYGRRVVLKGANDEQAAGKIQGMTLGGAYCDEVTLMPRSFFAMLLSRLSLPNAFLYATCNPDNPNHYIKADYIDNSELNVKAWNFRLDENTFLTDDFKESIASELTGVFYCRYVLGEWCISDGLVYQEFAENLESMTLPSSEIAMEDYAEFVIGCDYGIVNAQVFLLCGYNHKTGCWEAVEEYYHDGHTSRQLTDEDYYQALVSLGDRWPLARDVCIDPSAKSLIVLINSRHRFRAVQADNSVVAGISFVSSLFHTGRLKVRDGCKNLVRELQSYSWDTDSSLREGIDKPVKQDDHAPDALRYAMQTHVRPHAMRYGVGLAM